MRLSTRKLRRKIIPILAIVLVFAMTLVGCQSSDTKTSDTKTSGEAKKITIGGTLALSGSIGPVGTEFKNGIQLAIDDLNARGGKITYEFQPLDDQYQTPPAVANVQRLTGQGVKYIFGPMGDAATAVAKIAKDKKFMFIGTFSDILPNEIVPNYAFSMSTSADLHGKSAAEYVIKKGYKKPALVGDATVYGRLVIDGAAAALRKEGIEPVSYFFDLGQTDYKAQLTKIKAAGNDVIITSHVQSSAATMAKQMKDLGFKVDMVGTPSAMSDQLPTLAGDAGEGFVAYAYDPPEGWQKAVDLGKKYTDKFGKPMTKPGSTLALYDMMMMLAKSIEASSDQEDVDQVAKLFKNTKNYEGTLGPGISIDEKGFLAKSTETWRQIQGGKWVTITK